MVHVRKFSDNILSLRIFAEIKGNIERERFVCIYRDYKLLESKKEYPFVTRDFTNLRFELQISFF